MTGLFDYNTQNKQLIISEYGRSIQNLVEHICTIADRDARTKKAEAIITIMETLNPQVKEQTDYKQKLWDHLHIIADYQLDVNSPYPAPEKGQTKKAPDPIPYPSQPIRFRFYGRNLQYMVSQAPDMQDEELKGEFINLLASFMNNSSRNWNNENLTNGQIAEHLQVMSQNKLQINPEELEITFEARRKKNNNNQNFNNKPKHFNNKFKKHNNNFKNNR